MNESLRTRLLLDRITVQGPMLEVSCGLLLERSYARTEFSGFVLPIRHGDDEGELLPFLIDSGLVEQRRNTLRLSAAYRRGWSPRLNLLALLHQRTDVNHTFRFIWESLLESPAWGGRFLDRDQVWGVIEKTKPDGSALPPLNSNRMASWIRLASWIGLIQPERSNTFCMVPSLRFISEITQATLPVDQETALKSWVAEVEAHFFRLSASPGDLHQGIGTVLALLHASGRIQLTTYSDERQYLVGPVRATHITRRREEVR